MGREMLLYGVNYEPTEPPQKRDIVCPKCGGMVENKDKTGRWLYAPINLVCKTCNIEWVI